MLIEFIQQNDKLLFVGHATVGWGHAPTDQVANCEW